MKKTIIDLFHRKKQQLIYLMSSIRDLIDVIFNHGFNFVLLIIDLFNDKIKGLLGLIKDDCFLLKALNICCD